jgi:Predicted metal-binding protein related to the C-terminal domain of SecA
MGVREELEEAVTELRNLLIRCSTRSVVRSCLRQLAHGQGQVLLSPARQISFLLSVLLGLPEPQDPLDLDEGNWERVKALLNRMSSAYLTHYIPAEDEGPCVTPEWRRVREVAMGAFFHYFNSDLLASVGQIEHRIATYLAPFDNTIEELLGISATEAIAICRFITENLVANLNSLDRGAKEEEILQHVGKISLDDVEAAFPARGLTFWKQFSIARGEGTEVRYPTDPSIYDFRPMIRLNDRTAFCVTANSLFLAVLKTGEKLLAESKLRDKFFRKRDRALENEVAHFARMLLGPDATIWQGVYETPTAQKEHDVVAFDQHLCLIFEAKASPPVEPLRDPEKAYTRIRDAFYGDTGIQKAYEQGNRLVKRIRGGETVSLYDSHGREVGQLTSGSSRFIACVCVTRDDFGPLATDLSMLLRKEPEDGFPWAVNIIDLSTIAEAWLDRRWGSLELRRYLEQRLTLHGRVFSGYEIDYVGFFIKHGGFANIGQDGKRIYLNPGYSDILDDIDYHRYWGGPAVEIEQTEPILTDLGKLLTDDWLICAESSKTRIKVGRNEKCPCGSGKKYKKCCGQ